MKARLLLAGIAAAGLLSLQVVGEEKQTDGYRTRVDKRVQAWQPRKEERRLDDIGWAKDIRDALRLSRQHRRPIFFFSYSGTTDRPGAMAGQRC
jgi:hypothetical protein